MAKYEHELSALDDLALDDVQMDAALTFVLDFVRSCALAAHDALATRHDRRGHLTAGRPRGERERHG
jgi:hypothetical protein